MPAGLKVTLTENEDQTLRELEIANQVPRRTKLRASILRLNSRGEKINEQGKLSKMCSINSETDNSSLAN